MKITHVAEIVKLSHVAEIVKLTHVARILEAGSMYDHFRLLAVPQKSSVKTSRIYYMERGK